MRFDKSPFESDFVRYQYLNIYIRCCVSMNCLKFTSLRVSNRVFLSSSYIPGTMWSGSIFDRWQSGPSKPGCERWFFVCDFFLVSFEDLEKIEC